MTQPSDKAVSLSPEIDLPTPDTSQNLDLATLRGIAMHLADCLRQMVPEKAKKAARKDDAAEVVPWQFDLLLGRNQGVIDGLDKLSRIIVRLTDKEREASAPSHSSFDFTELDELDLERRIFAELDRVAEQRRTAIGRQQGIQDHSA